MNPIARTNLNSSTKSGSPEITDIGGSYPENELRLSDITLKWMVDFIMEEIPVEGRVTVDPHYMRLHPSSDGMMHDECMVGVGGTAIRWRAEIRNVPVTAKLHDTVYERLKMDKVRNFTSYGPYRPAALRNHNEAKTFFQPAAQPPSSEQVPQPRSVST